MFDNSSIMVLLANTKTEQVRKLEVNHETQYAVTSTMRNAFDKFAEGKSVIRFNGSYKPNDDEILSIDDFQLSDEIKEAIRDPLGVGSYGKIDGEFPAIKAIFVGERLEDGENEKFNIVFQRFRKEQYIHTNWFNLFFKDNTFFQENSFGISISDGIDCIYSGARLQFSSFFYARQIFDLSEYYRSATDKEVETFSKSSNLNIENAEAFQKMADTWIRRKIAMVNDSKVLESFPVKEIQSRAKSVGVNIEIKNKRIVIPNDKEQVKLILGFLDEEAYKGPFSQKTYLANSKRQVIS